MESQSLKLRTTLELHNLPNSPTHRFSLRVHPCELTSLPSLFSSSSSSSSNPSHTRILHQFSRIQTVPCFTEPVHFPIDLVETSSSHAFQSESKVEDDDTNSTPSDIGLIQHATVIKTIHLSLILISVSICCVTSKLSKERQRKLFLHINFVLFLVGGLIGALVLVTAEFIIHLYAPGLWVLAEGRITREIACAQLKIMIPCIVLAGPIGLGFGYMSAEGNNIVPSISPVLSSMLIIAGCFTYAFARQLNAFQTGDLLFGGILVSCGASLGVFLQWVIQVIVLWRRDYSMIPLSWMSILEDKDVHAFFSLLLPATISLAFAHIASFTDLCFSSLIPGATAGLSYAYLLVMAPLGLLSSIIILPLLPTFSKVAKTSSWKSMVENLRRAFLLCMHPSFFFVYFLCSWLTILHCQRVACCGVLCPWRWKTTFSCQCGCYCFKCHPGLAFHLQVLFWSSGTGTFNIFHNCFVGINFVPSPSEETIRFHKIQELLAISLAGTIGMITFFFPLVLLHLSGFQMVRDLARILRKR
ncbi:putative lipid II flippase MurJ [Camellia lanceoleosa]|uniref:Lipid II flippase MurJ n=1 Tax=Camellia lanceoleosa TaxID=1840588 RepID=A0ACC0J4C4_9ERIC|nr:putative lipid II flippase MurJ [Camellia lanceoleosa]